MMPGRVLTQTEAAEECSRAKASGRTVVFTNGCFDLLHRGHVHVLEQAASFGDVLVSSLRMVDIVVPFDEDTPAELIALLLPDVLVKGGDYTPGSVVGADTVIASGGRVEIVELLPGYSTSSLIERISNRDDE
jgi:cytidyltransferase-like protein